MLLTNNICCSTNTEASLTTALRHKLEILLSFYNAFVERCDKRLIPKFLLPLDFFALKVVIPNIADSGGGGPYIYFQGSRWLI